jgi:hypothetical protein
MATPTSDGSWQAIFSPGQLDKMPQAWAYNADTQTAYRLARKGNSDNESISAKK